MLLMILIHIQEIDHLAVFFRLSQYFFNLGIQSRGSWRGMPYLARQLFFLSIQICLICISDKVSFVKVRQNLFIQGDIEPGSVPQAYPLIPIIRAYNTTQKYLNSGRQPFFTKLWQVMSIALAIRNRPILCLVFFAKNRADIRPPRSPPIRGMYFWCYSLTTRRKVHMVVRKSPTKVPTKSPKLTASLPTKIFKISDGFLIIFLMEKSRVSPAFMRQVVTAILGVSTRIDLMQEEECLQQGVRELSQGLCYIGEI